MQQVLARLRVALTGLGLTVDLTKAKAMKFKREGRTVATCIFAMWSFAYVNYSGLLFSLRTAELVLFISLRDARRQCWLNGNQIVSSHVSRNCFNLFNRKVGPITTYEVRVIWKDLIAKNLEQINRIKGSSLERALDIVA